MVDIDLMTILRCPVCVIEGKGMLNMLGESWLVCKECGCRYPVVNGIPIFVIEQE